MGKCTERLYNGIVKENPTFVMMLGMCPTLAVTTSAINGAGMGLATTCILILSNMVISMLRKVIPEKVRIPSYIVIIASFVTIIQFLMEAYFPALNDSLGLYIPLIVVNCIILGRAESYASKNKVVPSIFDGMGMGLGFTVGLTVIGMFRELIGNGSIFHFQILGEGNLFQNMDGFAKTVGDVLGHYTPIAIFVRAPGAFLVLAFLIAFINKRNAVKAAKAGTDAGICRPEGCAACPNTMCGGRKLTAPVVSETEAAAETEKQPVVIPEKISHKPAEETEVSQKQQKSDAMATGEQVTEPTEQRPDEEAATETEKTGTEAGEEKPDEGAVTEPAAETETEETGTEAGEEKPDEGAVTEPAAETETEKTGTEAGEKNPDSEAATEKEAETKTEETGTEAGEETPDSEAVTKKEAETETEETGTEAGEENPDSETAEEPEAQTETQTEEPETEKPVTEIPQAKVQEVVSNVEEIQESMHESDLVSTSKLIRPEIQDASMVDKYEEFADVSAKDGKRRRKNKKGKGGKR